MQSINKNKEVTLFYADYKQEQKVTLCRVETRTQKQLCVQYKQQQRSNSVFSTSNIKEVTLCPKETRTKKQLCAEYKHQQEASLCSVHAKRKKQLYAE